MAASPTIADLAIQLANMRDDLANLRAENSALKLKQDLGGRVPAFKVEPLGMQTRTTQFFDSKRQLQTKKIEQLMWKVSFPGKHSITVNRQQLEDLGYSETPEFVNMIGDSNDE